MAGYIYAISEGVGHANSRYDFLFTEEQKEDFDHRLARAWLEGRPYIAYTLIEGENGETITIELDSEAHLDDNGRLIANED